MAAAGGVAPGVKGVAVGTRPGGPTGPGVANGFAGPAGAFGSSGGALGSTGPGDPLDPTGINPLGDESGDALGDDGPWGTPSTTMKLGAEVAPRTPPRWSGWRMFAKATTSPIITRAAPIASRAMRSLEGLREREAPDEGGRLPAGRSAGESPDTTMRPGCTWRGPLSPSAARPSPAASYVEDAWAAPVDRPNVTIANRPATPRRRNRTAPKRDGGRFWVPLHRQVSTASKISTRATTRTTMPRASGSVMVPGIGRPGHTGGSTRC